MPHRDHVPAHRVGRHVADRVLRERLRLPRPVDEDDELGRGDPVDGAVRCAEREVAARCACGRARRAPARSAPPRAGSGCVRVGALGGVVGAVIEPRARRVALEAVEPPGVGDLDRARARSAAPAAAGGASAATGASRRRAEIGPSTRAPRFPPSAPASSSQTTASRAARAGLNAASTTPRCRPPRAAPARAAPTRKNVRLHLPVGEVDARQVGGPRLEADQVLLRGQDS